MVTQMFLLVVLAFCFLASISSAQPRERNRTNLFSRALPQGFGRFAFNFAVSPIRPVDPDTDEEEEKQGVAGSIFFPGTPIFINPPPPPLNPTIIHSPCRQKPRCPSRGERFYRPDGTCNNLVDGGKGQAGRPHKRLVPAAYADGKSEPRRAAGRGPLPSTRIVSTAMQDASTTKSRKHAHILVIWCQFLTHDITNTPTINRDEGVDCRCGSRDPACYNIRVPRNDIQVIREGKRCLPLVRSLPSPDAECNDRVRQQSNGITSYIDASTVYGSSLFELNEYLDGNSRIGKLKTGDLHPYGESPATAPSLPLVTQVHPSLQHVACPEDVHKPQHVPCFAAGDDRSNENPALASFHTLFLRMHNNLVQELSGINRRWSRDQLIDNARLIVAAVTQRITYKEFLPELLGEEYMTRFGLNLIDEGYWHGYDSSYDATTSNGFATAALRFGHTLVTTPLSRPSPGWNRDHGHSMDLKTHFFNSNPLLTTANGGANSIMRGLCKDAAETADTTLVDDLHNFLFAPEGRLGHDLLAINLQRGRDHGLPGYNVYRQFCGLRKARSFNDLVEIPYDRRQKLRRVYFNRVDDIDLYIAGIAESPINGGLLGPTFSCILSYQFRDLKKGDRLWHENGGRHAVFTPAQLAAIREYKLSRLLCDHLNDMRTIQPNPFLQDVIRDNSRISCHNFPPLNLDPWREYYASNTHVEEPEPEKTAWFAAYQNGYTHTPRDLLRNLLVNRPRDVCARSLGSETRTVGRRRQYRYLCSPGSISATDYPNVDASKGVWTDWEDSSTPGRDDEERRTCYNHVCEDPIAIQVFTTAGVPARQTGEVFNVFSPSRGFVCRGQDQVNGRCRDYKVRYFCRRLRQPVNIPYIHPSLFLSSPASVCAFYGLCCNEGTA